MKHVAGLDGLRGIALVGVLLFHAGHLDGAFLSLDLFFVLSGFLITSLLLAEWERDGRIDLRRFWSRRARRLLPALVVVVVATTVYAAVELDPTSLALYRGDALAALFDVANWREIATGTDYWKAYAQPSPLRHTWSLSVEEQMYLAWPLLVVAGLWVGRRAGLGRRALLGLGLVLTGASVAAMGLLSATGDTTRAYYGTDTRASAVLLGGCAAVLGAPSLGATTSATAPRWLRAGAPLAAAWVAVGWVVADGEAGWTYRWGMPMWSAAAAVLVAAVALGGAGPLRPLVEAAPLQALGRISYGAYLWHWPAYLVLEPTDGLHGWPLTAVRIGASVVLGALSFTVVERPVRSGLVPTRAWRGLLVGGFAVAVASILVVTRDAGPVPEGGRDGAVVEGYVGGHAGAPRVLLLGDSHAFSLGQTVPEVVRDEVRLAQYALLGCGIGPGLPVSQGLVTDRDLVGVECLDAVDRFRGQIDQRDPDIVVLVVGAWEVLDRRIDGRDVAFGTAAWDDATAEHLHAVLATLARGDHRLVVPASACFDPDGSEPSPLERGDDRRVARWNELLRAAAPAHGVAVPPLDDLSCGGAAPPDRRDGVHLTPGGAAEVWAWLLPQLLDVVAGPSPGSPAP